jgi:hypothetical protein
LAALKLNAKSKLEGTELKPGNESLQVKVYKFEVLEQIFVYKRKYFLRNKPINEIILINYRIWLGFQWLFNSQMQCS